MAEVVATGCCSPTEQETCGALTREDFERELVAAGFETVEVQETHRVHQYAASSMVRG